MRQEVKLMVNFSLLLAFMLKMAILKKCKVYLAKQIWPLFCPIIQIMMMVTCMSVPHPGSPPACPPLARQGILNTAL